MTGTRNVLKYQQVESSAFNAFNGHYYMNRRDMPFAGGFSLLGLRRAVGQVPARPVRPQNPRSPQARLLEAWNSDVFRTIDGYDAAVIWKGARASTS